MDNPIEVHVDWGEDFHEHMRVAMITRDRDGRAHQVILTEIPETLGEVTPYFQVGYMTRSAGQWLMNRLWEMGLRPSGDATPGQLKAMQEHMKDLQLANHQMLEVILDYFRKRG